MGADADDSHTYHCTWKAREKDDIQKISHQVVECVQERESCWLRLWREPRYLASEWRGHNDNRPQRLQKKGCLPPVTVVLRSILALNPVVYESAN
jgi:hypothetical protein